MSDSRIWHGFSDMAAVKRTDQFVIERGEGAYLFDANGRRYLDAAAGLWFCNIGHGRREIAEAAADQMSRLAAYSTFGDYTNGPAEELAQRLAGISPTDGASVFFTNGGSESNDSVIKIVRHYWLKLGQPDRRLIVSRDFSYHGGTVGATALGGIALDRNGFGELTPDTVRIPWDSAEELEKLVGTVGAERVAAFILEPVIAAGGVRFPPEGYLERISEICREHGIILIADEVVTGFGRIGDWFASKRFQFQPDILVCAKGLTSGYAPLGALIASDRVTAPFYDGTVGTFYHGFTYQGHAVGTAVALANIEIMERERLFDNVLELEQQLPSLMAPVVEHELVKSVRTGTGLLAAVEFTDEAIADDAGLPGAVALAMRDAGVLTRSMVNGEIQFSPPLVIGPEQVAEFASAVLHGLEVAPSRKR